MLAKHAKRARSPAVRGFNYAGLEAKAAERARTAADNIRQMVRKSLEDLIDIGSELLAVKEALGHGRFQTWLDAESGGLSAWRLTSIAVAARFSKTAIVAVLPIEPIQLISSLCRPTRFFRQQSVEQNGRGTGEFKSESSASFVTCSDVKH
jgi:hypothetical protein